MGFHPVTKNTRNTRLKPTVLAAALLAALLAALVAARLWGAQYTAPFSTTPGASGRTALRCTVPNNFNADFIGLDSVSVTAVPEPQTAALLLLGLVTIGLARRRC